MKKLLLALSLLFAVSVQAAEPAKDYIIRGMPEYKIEGYSKGFEKLEIWSKQGSEDVVKTVYEGNQVYSWYIYRGKSEDQPSSLHQTRYYKEALKKLGGQILWEDGEERKFHASFKRNDKQYYMLFDSGRGGYKVWIIEPTELQVDVEIIDADTILHKLEKEGHIALYINFDTGKSTIKSESNELIDEIVAALKSKSDMKVKLEGHTDNVGTPADNKKLSNDRANAVMSAIVAKGINKSRLSAEGFGLEKPVADNGTEEGRARNRRVEMVRQ
ncbi:MAG: OmpA family protein [Betaproteobacteria bacterium]|nr:OmpA family protein [Betaproteobacteria bacterium]